MPQACIVGRRLQYYIGTPLADTAAFQALAVDDHRRAEGCICAKLDDRTLWIFDDDGVAPTGPTTIEPTTGPGQWVAASDGGGVGIGSVHISTVLCRTTAALAASTRAGAVLTRTGNGALGAHDGVTPIAGETILVANEAGGDAIDNGPHVVTDAGSGAAPWVLTRVASADVSAEVTAGMLHYISEGTVFGNEWAYLTNDDPIVLNTTQLAYAMIPNLVDLASVANGLGGSLIGIEDVAGRFAAATAEAILADLGARVALAFDDTTAQEAYAAAARADRQICIVDNDDAGAHADGSLWYFDGASAAGATDYVRVPDAGAGRWLRLIPTLAELVSAANTLGCSLLGVEDALARFADATVEAVLADLGARLSLFVADTAAQTALTDDQRADNQIVIVDNDDAGVHADGSLWLFDDASAAGATDYVRVPDAGTGRWHRWLPTLAELASTGAGLGASLFGIQDVLGLIAATTVEGATAELAADIDALSPGVPMQSRLTMLGAGARIVQGDWFGIGGDDFEFRDDTPPSGGTAGRIWVRTVTDSITCRTNAVDAINGVVDAARITYDGALTEDILAQLDPVTIGDIVVVSADAPGGNATPSATTTAVTENLTTATDIWDTANMEGGYLQAEVARSAMKVLTVTTEHIAKGTIEFEFDFTPARAVIVSNSRPQNEAWVIVGNSVSLTLTGGGAPNNQNTDVVTCIAQG